jgi:alpha-1,3-rhamnosyl/mannosyltransferase
VRVVIDVSYARRGPSGTGVYVERLLEALRGEGADVVEAAPSRPHRYLNLAAEAKWHARLARERGDVLHLPLPALVRGARMAQVVTVHDLAFLRVPECFNARFRAVATVRHRAAARRADGVIVPSEATAADVRSRFGVDEVTVALHGPGQAFAPGNRGQARHFLYVGDDEPRKNLGRLLAAYALYRESAPDPLELVLAGRRAPDPSAVRPTTPAMALGEGRSPGAPGVRVERAPDLVELHRHAAALVIPSLHEGFGIPALEAMHAGTPVIAARTAGLAEVCGDAARFVDPRDPQSIAAALGEVGGVPPLREELRRRGEARAGAFSWQRSARAHLGAYERAIRSRAAA